MCVTVKDDNQEHCIEGRAAAMITWLVEHAEHVNRDEQGAVVFDYSGKSVKPTHKVCLSPITI